MSWNPLANLLRPRTLDEVIGQGHLLAIGRPLRRLIESGHLSSIILFGPSGTGKTTIAELIASYIKYRFVKLNATSISIKQIREEGIKAEESKSTTVVFIDEIYRLTSPSQDAFLPFVERGSIILIGATVVNPFHSLNSSLISRSHIFILEPLSEKDLIKVLFRGVQHYKSIGINIRIDPEASRYIVRISCGDARKVLTSLELLVDIREGDFIDLDFVKRVIPSKYFVLDKSDTYDFASAFQGSIQASDADSAVYWLAKWLESGEDIRYISRRLLISAAEDAFSDPLALCCAQAAYTAANEIGRPECDIILSMATIRIAQAKRDKTAERAIRKVLRDIREGENVIVPKEMKDCHYEGSKSLGYGAYQDGMDQSKYMGVNKKYVGD